MITIQERSCSPTAVSRYTRIRNRIRELLKESPDLGLNVRYTNPDLMVVDVGRTYVRLPLTDIQIKQIDTIKKVIEKEFPSRFCISSNTVGTKCHRVQMHIPLR